LRLNSSFLALVSMLNRQLEPSSERKSSFVHVAVLDVFGFENFEVSLFSGCKKGVFLLDRKEFFFFHIFSF
jgi:hypothetical protein